MTWGVACEHDFISTNNKVFPRSDNAVVPFLLHSRKENHFYLALLCGSENRAKQKDQNVKQVHVISIESNFGSTGDFGAWWRYRLFVERVFCIQKGFCRIDISLLV
jgi:hypothetical protein